VENILHSSVLEIFIHICCGNLWSSQQQVFYFVFSTSGNVKNQKTCALAFHSPHHTAGGLIL